MKRFLVFCFVTAMLASEPVISRNMLTPVEKKIDQRLETLFDEPFLVLGMTRGLYIEKFGVVFSSEIQLLGTPGVGTFGFTAPTKEMVVSTRAKKLERLPVLREAMKSQLFAAATALERLPVDEKVVFGISIFRRNWEDTNGLPAQIVMQAVRKELAAARTPAMMDSAIRIQEF